MRLPSLVTSISEWREVSGFSWDKLIRRSQAMGAGAGNTNAFANACDVMKRLSHRGEIDKIQVLIRKRIYLRALLTLWADEDEVALVSFKEDVLKSISSLERVSKLSLLNLLKCYFRLFDELPHAASTQVLTEQLIKKLLISLFERKSGRLAYPLSALYSNKELVFSHDGPMNVAKLSLDAEKELDDSFIKVGVQPFTGGRFSQISSTLYYLETLKHIPFGENHSILDELIKPNIHSLPYSDELNIGHAAISILIDRCEDEPTEIWQNFILSIAGDPRIRSGAMTYRKWWMPLGEERIERVRSWLSREDLKLFLQAVEEYGLQTRNAELNRMFPSRKVFLEGLFKLKLVRRTRLMLGNRAKNIVDSILGDEMKTSFATLSGELSDRAIIYLDCGDFHLIEASHSFKIWVYFGLPHPDIISYDKTEFSAGELRSRYPSFYDRNNIQKCQGFVHQPDRWQYYVIDFLKRNNITLDEKVLLDANAEANLNSINAKMELNRRSSSVSLLTQIPARSLHQNRSIEHSKISERSDDQKTSIQRDLERLRSRLNQSTRSADANKSMPASVAVYPKHEVTANNWPLNIEVEGIKLTPEQINLLKYFGDGYAHETSAACRKLNISSMQLHKMIRRGLKLYFQEESNRYWRLSPLGKELIKKIEENT